MKTSVFHTWRIDRGLILLAVIIPLSVHAETLWKGDFETGDLTQWKSAPPTSFLKIVTEPVREGRFALRIDGTNAAERKGNDRIELQHQPPPAGMAEGVERYYGWSFFLPEKLPAGIRSLGYFETRNSWSRVMAFEAEGEDILFTTRVPYARRWSGKGRLTPGRWHDIALRVIWSRDAEKGLVEVWFDGEKVVSAAHTATLKDENVAFLQVGLFRRTSTTPETLYLDHIVEATTLEEVTPAPSKKNPD